MPAHIRAAHPRRAFCLERNASAMAYSATTVLPADVCAATRTDSPRSRHAMAVLWKGSSTKGYVFAGGPVKRGFRISSRLPLQPRGSATWGEVRRGWVGVGVVGAGGGRGEGQAGGGWGVGAPRGCMSSAPAPRGLGLGGWAAEARPRSPPEPVSWPAGESIP